MAVLVAIGFAVGSARPASAEAPPSSPPPAATPAAPAPSAGEAPAPTAAPPPPSVLPAPPPPAQAFEPDADPRQLLAEGRRAHRIALTLTFTGVGAGVVALTLLAVGGLKEGHTIPTEYAVPSAILAGAAGALFVPAAIYWARASRLIRTARLLGAFDPPSVAPVPPGSLGGGLRFGF
jgi:hypothetical protein